MSSRGLWHKIKRLFVKNPHEGKLRFRVGPSKSLPVATKLLSVTCQHEYAHIGQRFVRKKGHDATFEMKNCSRCVKCLKEEFYTI